METLLTRYRGLIALVLLLAAQLVMLGVQVRNQQDVRLVRVWVISAVTPFAMILEGLRSGIVGNFASYVDLRHAREDNIDLRTQLDALRRQNEILRAELATADRADRLLEFKQRIPSRTIAARVIGTNAAPSSRVVFIDRGTSDGLLSGMAVINGTGVVGRVLDAYPNTSQVMLITDPSFAMGVVSQKGRVVGTLRGLGQRRCMVDFVESHLTVEKGEWFYSSGDDRVFPRGLPVGPVVAVGRGANFQDISVEPAGMTDGLDEVLIVLEAVHQTVPPIEQEAAPLLAPPPEKGLEELPEVSMGETSAPVPEEIAAQPATGAPSTRRPLSTDADRLLERYRRIGEAQNHTFGVGTVGTPPPDFNRAPAPVSPSGTVTPGEEQNPSGTVSGAGTATVGIARSPGAAAASPLAPKPNQNAPAPNAVSKPSDSSRQPPSARVQTPANRTQNGQPAENPPSPQRSIPQ